MAARTGFRAFRSDPVRRTIEAAAFPSPLP